MEQLSASQRTARWHRHWGVDYGFWCSRIRPEAKIGRVPDWIVGAQAHKPAEQQVEVELLQWNRWASFQGIRPADGGLEPFKCLICQLESA